MRIPVTLIKTATLCAAVLAMAAAARADEADAKKLFKAMSDYLAAQKTLSLDFDSSLEVVTKEDQKVAFASSGSVTMQRPDKIRSTRHGGFADVELVFDGKTLSVLRKNANAYLQTDVPGSVDHLVDELRDKLHRPLPGADLLLSNVYDELMPLVTEGKDLGSGVIGGTECDHLAFRTKEVDWQIWIAQGDRPYPCRYVITTKEVKGFPQYTLDVRSFKTGNEVAADDFKFTAPAGAKQLKPEDALDIDELPSELIAKAQ
jgi:hypothetical protein